MAMLMQALMAKVLPWRCFLKMSGLAIGLRSQEASPGLRENKEVDRSGENCLERGVGIRQDSWILKKHGEG